MGALGILVLALAGAAFAWWSSREVDDPRVRATTIESRSVDHWRAQGFVEMVTPLRLPSSKSGDDVVTIWLRLPQGAPLDVTEPDDDGHVSLRYPVGAVADRVELITRDGVPLVEDVRGTTFTSEGEAFHVFRAAGAQLSGFEWLRGDNEVQQEATRRLEEMLRGQGAKAPGVTRLANLNRCARCHLYLKPPNQRVFQDGLPNLATDAGGLYTIQAVLTDRTPLEQSRPREMNGDDPHVQLFCPSDGDAKATIELRDGAPVATCPNGATPWGKLDVEGAVREGDERVLRLCKSRQYLRDHMTEAARKVHASAFQVCGI